MRRAGYREVRYWVPDASSDAFIQRIRAESTALNAADGRDGTAEFLDEVQAELVDGV